MSILDKFNGTPRPGQAWILPELAATWNDWDVAVVRADVGEGKSKIAECLSAWNASVPRGKSSAITVPTNPLLNQYTSSCKGLDSVKNGDLYTCTSDPTLTCRERKQKVGTCCLPPPGGNFYSAKACHYTRDLRRLRSTKRLVCTAHALLAHRVRKDLLIVDEAHTLIPLLQELNSIRLWQHKMNWPINPSNQFPALLKWVQSLRTKDKGQEALLETLSSAKPRYTIDMSDQEYYGTPRRCLTLVPVDTSRLSNPLLAGVKKIVLMSATINDIDIHQLGLSGRRVKYFELPSSIPVASRPVCILPVADMRFAGREAAWAEMARFIDEELLEAHAGERGLIHATYEFARYLQQNTKNKRLLFHTSVNKKSVLESYLRIMGGSDDRVLVGSGMYEGLDLKGDLARFQLITQVPRRSLEDPGTAWLAANEPHRYEWLTIRDITQALGRVSRDPSDFGLSIIADSSYMELEMNSPLLPDSVREATYIQARD